MIKMPMLLLAKTSHIGSAWECSLVLVVSHLHLPLDASDLHRYNQFQTLYSLGFFYNTDFFFLPQCHTSLLKGFCKAFDVNTVTLIK